MSRRSTRGTLIALTLGVACVSNLTLQRAFLSGTAVPRREVLAQAAAGVLALGGAAPALADWQGEPVRITQLFGPIILGAKPSVEKGDLDRLTKVYNKMELYARGVYKNNAAKQSEAMATVDKLADALEAKNIAGAQSSYNEFLKVTSLPELFKGPKGSNYHLLTPTASMSTR